MGRGPLPGGPVDAGPRGGDAVRGRGGHEDPLRRAPLPRLPWQAATGGVGSAGGGRRRRRGAGQELDDGRRQAPRLIGVEDVLCMSGSGEEDEALGLRQLLVERLDWLDRRLVFTGDDELVAADALRGADGSG